MATLADLLTEMDECELYLLRTRLGRPSAANPLAQAARRADARRLAAANWGEHLDPEDVPEAARGLQL